MVFKKGHNLNKGKNNPMHGKIPWNKDKKFKKINGKKQIGEDNGFYGKKHSEETKKKMKEKHKKMYENGYINPMKGKRQTKESIEKNRQIHLGKKVSNKTKLKMRNSMINYIKTICGQIRPNIGKNEIKILDNLENKFGYKIIRQYRVCGYFVDGYCKELNLVIEVDEKHHINQQEKDKQREQNIQTKLNCKILRIKDYG